MVGRTRPAGDLRDACLREALALIGEQGLEALSLREVARRLGVSHQSPYRHFPSRDHILAEIVARAFTDFAAHLDARPSGADPAEDLGNMGRAYLGYAAAHPLHYRLMFGNALPDPAAHPEMLRLARHAFSLLRDAVARLPGTQPDLDAMFIWASIHGLASVSQIAATHTLCLPVETLAALAPHAMARLGMAMQVPPSLPQPAQ